VLCGTGFFEHFNEFRCTPIGDISDEGTVKALSAKEDGISDGLLGKLGVGDLGGVFDDVQDAGRKNRVGKDTAGEGKVDRRGAPGKVSSSSL